MSKKRSIVTVEGFKESYVDINKIKELFGSASVTMVTGMSGFSPDGLKAGQFVYDTESGTLYVVDPSADNGIVQMGSSDMPYVDYSEEVEPNNYNGTPINNNSLSIPIEPNKYYDFGVRPIGNAPMHGLGILPIKLDPNVAYQYCGRFTVHTDDYNGFVFQLVNKRVGGTGTFPMVIQDNMGNDNMSLYIGGNVPEFENGHTYEFTIVYDCCIITDITRQSTTTNTPSPR